MAETAFIALGSNLGHRACFLGSARNALSLLRCTRLRFVSGVAETAPFGSGAQGAYLNQMVMLDTALSPFALLSELQRIEKQLGRVRRARWVARSIDLDIVRYGDRLVTQRRLTLPHPSLANRSFWRTEMAELEALAMRAT